MYADVDGTIGWATAGMSPRRDHNKISHAMSEVAGADRALLDVGPFAKGGSPYTPNQSSYDPADFRQTIGPSARLIIDLGNMG